MPRVVGGLPVSVRVAFLAAEVMCFGLRKRRRLNMWWILRGSKAHMVSDGVAVSQVRTSKMVCRCILAMLEGENESTLGGTVDGEGLGCLGGGESEEAGLGVFVVGGLDEVRALMLSRYKGFLVMRAIAGQGFAQSILRSRRARPMGRKMTILSVVEFTSMAVVGKGRRLPTVSLS